MIISKISRRQRGRITCSSRTIFVSIDTNTSFALIILVKIQFTAEQNRKLRRSWSRCRRIIVHTTKPKTDFPMNTMVIEQDVSRLYRRVDKNLKMHKQY